jgi:hypothetical protein
MKATIQHFKATHDQELNSGIRGYGCPAPRSTNSAARTQRHMTRTERYPVCFMMEVVALAGLGRCGGEQEIDPSLTRGRSRFADGCPPCARAAPGPFWSHVEGDELGVLASSMLFTSSRGEGTMATEMALQIRIQSLHLEPNRVSQEQRVVVEGSSPQGAVSAAVLDGPAANLVTQILTTAGIDVLRARLGVEPRLWFCTPFARQMVDGILRLEVRDAACIRSLCEHIRSAVFVSERGEPILEGFPPYQGENFGQ